MTMAFACGGPSKPSQAPLPETGDPVSEPVGDSSAAQPDTTVALPQIPSTPASVPANLMAEIVLSNPNAQLTKVGLLFDAVQPGMGAFVTPTTFLQMLSGVAGATGMDGVDLEGPVYVVVLDTEEIVVVVTMASEAELRTSLEGSRAEVLTHQGFAAIGTANALTSAAPYALSNLITQPKPAQPTLNLHIAKIMKGSQREMIRSQLGQAMRRAGAAPAVSETFVGILDNVGVLRTSLDASPTAATLHMDANVLGGPLQTFLGKQRPADFSMLDRMGTGPWGLAGGGRVDISVFAPLLVALGEAEANPILTQIAAQLSTLNGEMGFGLNLPDKPEFVMGVQLQDAKGIAQVVDTLMSLVSKKKNQEIDGMKAKIKLRSIKTRAGSLHELRAKPTSKEQIAMYGKKNVSGFFGVAVDSLIATFGVNAKKHAKTLSAASGKIAGSGTKLAAAIALSKSARESFLFSADVTSLNGQRPPKDVDLLILGVGFDESAIRARLVMPTSFVKEAAKGPLF